MAARVYGQMFANTNGDADAALAYYTAPADDKEVLADMLQILAEGVAGTEDRLADKYGMNKDGVTDQTEVFHDFMSPEYPEKPDSEKMHLWATQEKYGKSYLYQYMRGHVAQEYANRIDVWLETPGAASTTKPSGCATATPTWTMAAGRTPSGPGRSTLCSTRRRWTS